MEAVRSETENTARTLLNHLQTNRVLGEGFFSSISPQILSARISAAESVGEMPTSQEVENDLSSKNGVTKHPVEPDEFLPNSSIHPENYQRVMSPNLVKVFFHKDSANNPLSSNSICLAFVIICDETKVKNGKPCCNRVPRYNSVEEAEEYRIKLKKQLKNTKRVFEKEHLW